MANYLYRNATDQISKRKVKILKIDIHSEFKPHKIANFPRYALNANSGLLA